MQIWFITYSLTIFVVWVHKYLIALNKLNLCTKFFLKNLFKKNLQYLRFPKLLFLLFCKAVWFHCKMRLLHLPIFKFIYKKNTHNRFQFKFFKSINYVKASLSIRISQASYNHNKFCIIFLFKLNYPEYLLEHTNLHHHLLLYFLSPKHKSH